MVKAVLFDLDGTLLPMDHDVFLKEYFSLLAKKLAPFGYQPNELIRAILHGTEAMVKNNGIRTNEEVFWNDFTKIYGEHARTHEPLFADFYAIDFQKIQNFCGYDSRAASIVSDLKDAGTRVILATNPIFPAIAIESRIRWAGLTPEDFEFYTSYENFGYSKPNIAYYRELLNRRGLFPKDCVMVGNDVDEDMVAEQIGMQVFLLTDCLINKSGTDISDFPQGNFDDLREFLF
jgi:HAD superfamily hydrolase (TIGR01549 family)